MLKIEPVGLVQGKEYEATKKKWGRSDGLNKKVSGDNNHIHLDKPKGRTRELIAEKYNVGETAVKSNIDFPKGIDVIAEVSPVGMLKGDAVGLSPQA